MASNNRRFQASVILQVRQPMKVSVLSEQAVSHGFTTQDSLPFPRGEDWYELERVVEPGQLTFGKGSDPAGNNGVEP